MAEKEPTEGTEPETYGDVRESISERIARMTAEDEGVGGNEADEDEETPTPDADKGSEAEDDESQDEGEEQEEGDDKAASAKEAGSDEDEEAGDATPSGDEPEGEGRPAEAESPEREAEAKPALEGDRVITLESEAGELKFSVADLQDDEKFAEFEKELERSTLRMRDYTQKTMQVAAQRKLLDDHTETIRGAYAAFEKRVDVVPEILLDEDLSKIVREFGKDSYGGKTLIERLIANPEDTRALIRDPAAKERLWDKMERLRTDPSYRAELEAAEQARTELPATRQQAEQYQQAQMVRGFMGALDQTIANYGAAYPGVKREAVEEFVLGTVGLTPEEWATADSAGEEVQRKVRRGIRQLMDVYMETDAEGNRSIRPYMIEREFQRLAREATADDGTGDAEADPQAKKPAGKKPGKKAQKVEEHNETVRRQLEESEPDPAPVPSGAAPGDTKQDSASVEDYNAHRRGIMDKALAYRD